MKIQELQILCEALADQLPDTMTGEEIALLLAYIAWGYSEDSQDLRRHLINALNNHDNLESPHKQKKETLQ